MSVRIADLKQYLGQSVTLAGWVYNQRDSGKVVFIILRDGTGLCQCVVSKTDETASFFDEARHLTQETSLRITGIVQANERQAGGAEIAVTALDVVHPSHDYPITPKPHGIDFLMKHRHLHFRSQRQWTILRIRATLVDAIRSFFNSHGFTLIDTPIFSPAAGEGAQTLFTVDYFGEPVYLAQTGQLYVEAACMAFGRVYCFGPTFRAEKSKTRRHLTEFWMVEPEIAYADLDDVMAVAEDFVRSIVARVLQDHRTDLVSLGRDVATLENINQPFDRITHAEAGEMLRGAPARDLLQHDQATKTARVAEIEQTIPQREEQLKAGGLKKFKQDQLTAEIQQLRDELHTLRAELENIPHHLQLAANFDPHEDLGGSDETIIARLHDRPVFVTHYPRGCKAFYMKVNAADPTRVNNFDLLAPEGYGEIIGGSQREDDLNVLLDRMAEQRLKPDDYHWYLDLRRYGSVPHGGFGLGVERTLAWLCGLEHIREAIPFARMMGKMYPDQHAEHDEAGS